MTTPLVSVVVPTYKERENIQPLMEQLHDALIGLNYKTIVVDDNSPD